MSETGFPSKSLDTSLWQNRKCLLICLYIAMANLQYGFDSSAVGALQAMPGFLEVFGYPDPELPGGYGIDPSFQRLITSLLTLGAFISSLLTGAFSIYFGRRQGLGIASLLGIVGVIVQIVATAKGVLYFGRLVLGLSNGLLATCSTIYLSEVAPAHLRGLAVGLFTFWILMGSVLGTAVDYATSTSLGKSSYQIPLGCMFIIPILLGTGAWFVPESPRYLLYHSKNEAARKALERLRGSNIPREHIELEWAEMIRGVQEENRFHQETRWTDMFRGVDLRRTLLCHGMIAIQTAAGIWLVVAYQTYFFSINGVANAFGYSIMNNCLGFAATMLGLFLLRYVGHRVILLVGTSVGGLCMLATAIPWSVSANNSTREKVLIGFWAVFYFFYSGSIGTLSYPVATGIVSNKLRAWTVGSATSLGFVLAWACSFFTPYFINPTELNWGAKYDYIWAGGNFAAFLFVFFFVPELKGRSLEEVDQLFAEKVSVREFPKYHCTILDQALHDVQLNTGLFKDNIEVTHIDNAHEHNYLGSLWTHLVDAGLVGR